MSEVTVGSEKYSFNCAAIGVVHSTALQNKCLLRVKRVLS